MTRSRLSASTSKSDYRVFFIMHRDGTCRTNESNIMTLTETQDSPSDDVSG